MTTKNKLMRATRKNGVKDYASTTLTMHHDMIGRLNRAAKATGLSRSLLVRNILGPYLDMLETVTDNK